MQLATPLSGFRKLRHRPGLPIALSTAIGLNLGQWGYMLWRVHPQAESIPLHYTIAFGIDRIGSWMSAYLLPVTGSVLLIGNLLVATLIVEHQPTTASFLLILNVFLEIVLLAGALLVFRPL